MLIFGNGVLTSCLTCPKVLEMTGYTKLFGILVGSSVWDEDDKTRIVWVTMLALKDRNHVVPVTDKALAVFARVPYEDCLRALEKFQSPDPSSRTPDNEGRRIKRVDGGWLILNSEKYARMLSKEERREYNTAKQAEYRKRKKLVANSGASAGASKAIREGLEERPGGVGDFRDR